MTTRLDPVLDLIDSRIDADIDSLLDLMAIPSISSDPAAAPDVREAAQWLDRALADMGFASRVVETAGHPVVLAKSDDGPTDGPGLLFYGHYDVQPVGDLADWTHPPFEPRIIEQDGLRRIYGRGASDSKSQLWAFVQGLRAWREVNGGFPGPVTILLEGEEEAGSYSLPAFIDTHRDELACDIAFICDSEMWSHSQPALTLQLKGLVHERVTIRGPNPDLHSGHWGAAAVNPVRVLANVLAGLHDDTGRVTIAGFYDGVQDIPSALRDAWAQLAREPGVIDSNDLTGGVVEPGFTPIEAMWGRPTVDINGVTAGNQGPGERSVVPGSATARLSFRLVAGQAPETIRARFRAHVEAQLPPGCRVEFEGHSGSAASALDPDNRFTQAAARGLKAEWACDVVLKGSGGAIPLVQEFSARLGVDCVLIGFILGGDAIHAPDERYDTTRFHKSVRAWARILAEIEAMA